jgi:hypothetical protein
MSADHPLSPFASCHQGVRSLAERTAAFERGPSSAEQRQLAQTCPAPRERREPGKSDFGAFSKRERVLYIHAQIAYGILDLV